MITVSIFINGSPIYTRSAVNVTEQKAARGDCDIYDLDTGKTLYHERKDGAVKLAIEMLGTIRETK